MLKIFVSACLLAAALGASIPQDDPVIQEHIVGGRNTDISEIPYQVALLKDGFFVCGGSVVSPTAIVTAAHCLVGASPKKISFRAGATNVYQGGVIVKAKAVYSHSSYDDKLLDYDVGVVELETPLQFTNTIKPIKLATSEPPTSAIALVSGWGLLKENGDMASDLQSVKVPVVRRAICTAWYQKYVTITPRMMCAGYEGKDACQGDSGGPLAYNGQLVGIVSFGEGCARRNFPGVYTNVVNPEITAFIRKYAKI